MSTLTEAVVREHTARRHSEAERQRLVSQLTRLERLNRRASRARARARRATARALAQEQRVR